MLVSLLSMVLYSVVQVGRLLCMPFTTQWPTNRLLSTAARLVEHAWNERLATLGVTHAGVMALDVLKTAGSMTQAQLAHRVRVQAQTMGKTLHRLELHGHVNRSKNVHDRRSHLVSITPEGLRILEAATQLEDELVDHGLLTDENLRRTLADIITTLGGARWKLRVQPDGTVTDAVTTATTVREALQAAGLVLAEGDVVSVPLDAPAVDGLMVLVTRAQHSTVTDGAILPFTEISIHAVCLVSRSSETSLIAG